MKPARILALPRSFRAFGTEKAMFPAADVARARAFRKQAGPVASLNLGGLNLCAPEGIGELKAWLEKGARLNEATPCQRMLLKGSAHGMWFDCQHEP